MKKKTLKLSDIYRLEVELNGGKLNTPNGEKTLEGLLSQKLNLVTKYWVNDLYKNIKEQKEQIDTLRNEIIMKYGEKVGENMQLSYLMKNEKGEESINPNFIKFQQEFDQLLLQEREIEYKQLKLKDISDIETSDVYEILFTLLDVED